MRRGAAGKLKAAAAAFYRRIEPPREGDVIGGMLAAAASKEVVEIWPENWPAWQFFMSVRTQWNEGLNGRTGLRYEAIYPLLDRLFPDPADWQTMFDDLQTLEIAALNAMHEK